MATARMMAARFWELYSIDVIMYGVAIIAIVCFLISPILGFAVGYVFFVLMNALIWEKRLPPFNWTDSDRLRWLLVVLGPITSLCIAAGCLVAIAFAPFFWMWSIHRDNLKAGKPTKFKKKNWAIGICIYYLVLAGVVFGIIKLLHI